MEQEASVKTITQVNSATEALSINCFSDENSDGTTTPVLYQSQILANKAQVDDVDGEEGDLVLSQTDDVDDTVEDDGSLQLEIDDGADDVTKYSVDNQNLEYND
jgi:hypothetical protein